MRIAILALVASLTYGCTADRKKGTLPIQIDALLTEHPQFSGVVLVAENGKSIYHRAFGYRNNEQQLPNDTATVFELASVSKQFTSMIIMMLKEEGKLDYEDSLEKFVAGLPYPGITIRHLLTHTSGLPDYQAIMDQHWDKTKVAGNPEIIAYLKAHHPERHFAPGEKYEYSNTGYIMLAAIAEAASGEDFISLCRTRIFTPLQMTSTDIRTLDEKAAIENFAKGYIYVREKEKYIAADSFPSSNYIVWLGNRKGPGRVSSTASDLLRWDRALYGNTLVKSKTLEEAYSPFELVNNSLSQYGFGWDLEKHSSLGRKIWHSGSNPGYSTRIVRYVDADKTIIVLSNNAYPRIEKLDSAFDALLASHVSSEKP